MIPQFSRIFTVVLIVFFAIGAGVPSEIDLSKYATLEALFVSLGALIFFLLMAAFYAGSETGLVSVNKTKIDQLAKEGNRKAKIIQKSIRSPEKMLAMTLVGTNLAHVLTSQFSLRFAIALIANFVIIKTTLGKLHISEMMVATSFTSILMLIFGEILPKTIFRAKADQIVVRYAFMIRISEIVMMPITYVISLITGLLIKRTSKNESGDRGKILRDELRLLATMGEQSGAIERDQRRMIHSALDFQQRTIGQVMNPLVEIVAIEKSATIKELLEISADSGFSRIPIYDDRIFNIIGAVHILDILYAESETENLSPFIQRDLFYVPESKNINDLLKELQQMRQTMVFVVDEYGGLVGLATVEDLVEEIVGEFADERDEDLQIRQISPKMIECDGKTEIDQLNDRFELNVPIGDYETIAGFILQDQGSLPKPNTRIETENFELIVSEASARAIRKVVIRKKIGSFDI